MDRAEPFSETPEPGNDLVKDEESTVLVAEFPQRLQIALFSGPDAACALNWLGKHGCDFM